MVAAAKTSRRTTCAGVGSLFFREAVDWSSQRLEATGSKTGRDASGGRRSGAFGKTRSIYRASDAFVCGSERWNLARRFVAIVSAGVSLSARRGRKSEPFSSKSAFQNPTIAAQRSLAGASVELMGLEQRNSASSWWRAGCSSSTIEDLFQETKISFACRYIADKNGVSKQWERQQKKTSPENSRSPEVRSCLVHLEQIKDLEIASAGS